MLDFIAGMSIKVCLMPKHTVVHSGQRIAGTEHKKALHWQIHATLVVISESWWRGRDGRGFSNHVVAGDDGGNEVDDDGDVAGDDDDDDAGANEY